jgi:hypothetical protein
MVWWILILAAAALAVIGVWLVFRWRARRTAENVDCPRRLLKELCVRHGLGYRQRRLVAGLAQERQLEQPALLFVDPRLWEVETTSPFARRQRELEQLRDRLFAVGEIDAVSA